MAVCNKESVTAVVLAGGRATRFGELDKGLVELRGKPLVQHAVDAISSQVHSVLISANRNLDTYLKIAPVVTDGIDGYAGPLAGMLSALQEVETPYLVTLPCDAPHVSSSLVSRLCTAATEQKRKLAVAYDERGKMQPVFALIETSLVGALHHFLQSGGRKAAEWIQSQNAAFADFSDVPKSFKNINTPDDLKTA
ncbi:MAG: molybdenum cofactor guanylyltransferase [Gammaproteobacteria bacterium]|nr:MAG: molybdenum cofactor guanylyltransferase [Gammaproteobacteria bacterium]